jgi:hypothetical protein
MGEELVFVISSGRPGRSSELSGTKPPGSAAQFVVAQVVPAPCSVPPAVAHWAGVASMQVEAVQQACVALQLLVAQVVPAPSDVPPRAVHWLGVTSWQPAAVQQACVGCGHGGPAHDVPAPAEVPPCAAH